LTRGISISGGYFGHGVREVVGDEEVAEPAAEVAARNRNAARQLALTGDGELPAIGPLAPSIPRVVVCRALRHGDVAVHQGAGASHDTVCIDLIGAGC